MAELAYRGASPTGASQRMILRALFFLLAGVISVGFFVVVHWMTGVVIALVSFGLVDWFFSKFIRLVSTEDLRDFFSIYYSGPMARSIPEASRLDVGKVENPSKTAGQLVGSAPAVATEMVARGLWSQQEADSWKRAICVWAEKMSADTDRKTA